MLFESFPDAGYRWSFPYFGLHVALGYRQLFVQFQTLENPIVIRDE
jgi:hypothetical protein